MTTLRKILVVDDEIGFRQMFTFLLEPLGFEVTCVENGLEAVKKVEEQAYDLILMDVHMPILTGPEALKKIKALRPSQKVVILSSSSDPEHVCESTAENERAIICLYKPLELDDIQMVLEKALGTLPKL